MATTGDVLYNGIEICERDRALLQRSDARIAKIDKSSLNKSARNQPKKGQATNQDMMARRWNLYASLFSPVPPFAKKNRHLTRYPKASVENLDSFRSARRSGIQPSLSLALISTPSLASSSLTTTSFPLWAAHDSGDRPPLSSSNRTMASCPLRAGRQSAWDCNRVAGRNLGTLMRPAGEAECAGGI
jgi:hypothetical protein